MYINDKKFILKDQKAYEHPVSQIQQGNTMGVIPANRSAIRLQGNHKR